MNNLGTIHLHVNNLCNLTCLHCYSSSGPRMKDKLDLNSAIKGCAFLRELGYTHVSISGGEPFLYPHISELVSELKALGFLVTIATNGTVVKRVEASLLKKFDGIAISLEGGEETHNYIRNSRTAFKRAVEGIEYLQELGVSFSITSSFPPNKYDDWNELVKLTLKYEASSLHIHPIEQVGRNKNVQSKWADEEEQNYWKRLFLFLKLFQLSNTSGLNISSDLLSVEELDQINTLTKDEDVHQVLPVVCITEKGEVLPFAYNLGEEWSMGSLYDHNFPETFRSHFNEKISVYQVLISKLRRNVIKGLYGGVVNWYSLIQRSLVNYELVKV